MENQELVEGKNRHWLLTGWLYLTIVLKTIIAFYYVFMSNAISAASPEWTHGKLILIAVFTLASAICAVALLKWRKWGFWGVAGVAFAVFVLNLSAGTNLATSLLGLLSIVILYGLLQKGGPKKAWNQLF